MSSYIVASDSNQLSLTFNQAVEVLSKDKRAKVESTIGGEYIVVEAKPSDVAKLEKKVTGWKFYPNSKIDLL